MKYILSLFYALLFCAVASAQGIITTIAGGGNGGDGVVATQSSLDQVNDVLVDTSGNVYIAEETAIRKIDVNTQIISLYAGSYQPGIGCDSCAATTAKLSHANAIAFDKQGNLYIADWGSCRIRKVDAVTGIMTTYAGNGTVGYTGDNGPAKNAQLRYPLDIAFDANDNLYIADKFYHIRRVDRQTGIITTIGGDGTQGTWNNGDTASKTKIGGVGGICVDGAGNIYFADGNNRKIGKINSQGIITNYCGNGMFAINGDGGLAVNASTLASRKIRLDKNENIYLPDGYVRRINNLTGIIEAVVGTTSSGFSGDGGPAFQAQLHNPASAFPDKKNNLFIADQLNYRIRKVAGLVSVNDPKIGVDLLIYPNPSAGIFTVACSETIRQIEVRSILGQLVYAGHSSSNKILIDISHQPSGVYLISVFGEVDVASKKLIINH
ncbi:MAG TPA: T9SS type A sorting domain-containing protein [Flavipsychrobacter sp.]|nr:T9SS type A sorting domain-containing protein [Flavipsychrobacter sp.]